MKKYYFPLLLLFVISSNCFSQAYMEPLIKKSFAVNRHTNRDYPYWSQSDGNTTIITATTERDSTFNDIQVIKLDAGMTAVWSKRISLPTSQSFDTPKATLVDSSGDIYVIASSYTGILYDIGASSLFITKIAEDGTDLWSIDLGECVFQNAFIDEQGELRVVYTVISGNYESLDFHFKKFDQAGSVTEDIVRNDAVDFNNNDISSLNYKTYYAGGYYYMLYQRQLNLSSSPFGLREHFIKKINSSGMQTFPLNDFMDSADSGFFDKGEFQIDENSNMYFAYPLQNTPAYHFLKLNSGGALVYQQNSPVGNSAQFLKSFINPSGNFCVLNNRSSTSSGNITTLHLTEYAANGTMLTNIAEPNTASDAIKINADGKILAYCNGSFKLFTNNLSLISQFTTVYSEMADFNMIGDANIVVLTRSFAKMYPESNQYTQIDIIADKINTTSLAATYKFSGEGTSRSNGEKLLVDHDNNNIVLSRQKTGESNFGVGGTIAPDVNFVYKYDSNLNLLWRTEILYEVLGNNAPGENCIIATDNSIFIAVPENYELNTYRLIKLNAGGQIVFSVPCMQPNQIFVDNNNNINIITTEDVNFSDSVFNSHMHTYSSTDGSLLATYTLAGSVYLKSYISGNGDSFLYMYDGQTAQPNISKKLRIYKNLNLISSINLNIFGPYDYLGSFATDANGTMYLVTNPSGLPNRLNKITLNGDHTSVIIPDLAGSIQMFNSGKLLLYFDGGQVNIYNPDLTLYSSNTNIGYETDYYPRLFATGNYIFLQSFHGDMARIINEDAQEVAEVQIQGSLSPLYSKGFLNGDIITTGNFGNQLNIYTEYSWSRGFIHKYNIEQALLLNPESPESYDTGITIYPNPSTGIVNFKTPAGIVITKAELYDLTGKLLFETKTSYIDLTGLNTAIYLLRIVTADDAMTFKIIKNN